MAMFGFGDLLDRFRTQGGAQQPGGVDRPASIFGPSKAGRRASNLAPEFLRTGSQQAGPALGQFFAQAFQQLDDPRALNRQLNVIGHQVSQRARRARTAGKFKGSPIGEALAQGVETGGLSLEQQARLADRSQRLRSGAQLAQAFTGAMTSPLLQVLGISEGSQQAQQALAEQRRQFDKSQPSTFDKILGTVGGVLCWVAREVLQDDRWLAAREFMLHNASDETVALYRQHGEDLAEAVKDDPDLRAELKPVFEDWAQRGQKYLGR